MPLPRMTTRRWMVAVALLAVLIAGVRAATRPIPEGEAIEVGTGRTFWSDGVVTSGDLAHLEVPRPVENKYILFCRVVRWSDGSISFRFRLP